MSEHGLEEFEYAQGDLRIHLKKAVASASSAPSQALSAASQSSVAATPARAETTRAESEPVAASAPAAAPADDLHVIKSPIVGTFYAAPNPESGPFVKVGDTVQAGQTVCIIEAMKLMNEIEADISGKWRASWLKTGSRWNMANRCSRCAPQAIKNS